MLRPIRRFNQKPDGAHFVIVASQYNSRFVDAMVAAARSELRKAKADKIEVFRTPGSYEIPLIVAEIARRQPTVSAIIALGVIFRGETLHAQLIAESVTGALMDIQLETGVPCGFGLLTVDTMEQALERVSGGAKRDTGRAAAEAALASLAVKHEIASEATRAMSEELPNGV